MKLWFLWAQLYRPSPKHVGEVDSERVQSTSTSAVRVCGWGGRTNADGLSHRKALHKRRHPTVPRHPCHLLTPLPSTPPRVMFFVFFVVFYP